MELDWSEAEIQMIKDAVDEHKRVGWAIRSLSKVLLHRNTKDIRAKALEIMKERSKAWAINPKPMDDIQAIKKMIDDVDKAIGYLESLKDRIEELKSKEADFDSFMGVLRKLKKEEA